MLPTEALEKSAAALLDYQGKGFGIAEVSHRGKEFDAVADMLLFDAKAPAGSHLPGGNGIVFDWNILKNVRPQKPWMLSGGLTPENVGEALKVLTPAAVDVSSGVEDSPGVKSPDKIRAFVAAVKNFTQTGTQG